MIIGCGIAGPVAAMALQRAGFSAAIYEARDRPADYAGSFLNLACNGIDALQAINAGGPVLARGIPTPHMVMWSACGARLGQVANGIALPDGTTSQTIQRGLLHQALRDEAMRRGVAVLAGKRVVGVEAAPGGVRARFEDGSEALARILIGADGIHSRIRQLLDSRAPVPRDTGLVSVGGRADSSTLTPTPGTFHMIFGRQAFFGYTVCPSGEVCWFANLTPRDVPSSNALSDVSVEAWKERLGSLFAGDVGPASAIVQATRDSLAAYPIFDMPRVPIWHSGSVVIIGDAAHAISPSSGQGASLAIEDAVVLAQCLRDHQDVPQALALYEQIRRSRVERAVAWSARVGKTKTPGPVGRWLRDLLMPVGLRLFANPKAQAWLYAQHIAWDEHVAAGNAR